jgi:hypothetical protein
MKAISPEVHIHRNFHFENLALESHRRQALRKRNIEPVSGRRGRSAALFDRLHPGRINKV